MDMEKRKKKVALSSVFASLLLTLLKLVVGILTGSIGIISEAAHSALDFAAAFITYLAVRISGKPADITHHYGHGKVESVSALIETGLLILTSFWIIYEAIQRLIVHSVEIEVTWYAYLVMLISIVIDFTRSRALKKVAKETNSQALEADALHFQSDIYSSAVVIAGLFFVSLGIKGADAIAAIGVALLVLFASYRLGKRTIDVLIDAAPEGLTDEVKQIVEKVDGVVGIDRIRVRPAGPSIFVDMIVTISRKAPIEQVDKITKTIQNNIQKKFSGADIVVHVKPIALKGETLVERVQTIAVNHNAAAHDVSIYSIGNKKFINFDLEVDRHLTLNQAHELATHLEDAIRNELGENVNVSTHIEPTNASTMERKETTEERLRKINKTISNLKSKNPSIIDIHGVTVSQEDKKLYISMHAVLEKKLQIEKAHDLSNKIENSIRNSLPNVENVLIHVEPNESKE